MRIQKITSFLFASLLALSVSAEGFDKAKFEAILDKFGMAKEKSQWLQ